MAGELNDKQRRFVDEYIVDLNATRAAIRAGYSERSAYSQAHELLKKPEVASAVQAAFEQRAERLAVDQDDVVRALMAVAFFDVRKLAEWGREEAGEGSDETLPFFRLRPSSELEDDVVLALQEVRVDAGGQLVVKASDKLRALELLGRHLGMFKRDVDVNVNVGITLAQLHELADAADGEAGDDEPG